MYLGKHAYPEDYFIAGKKIGVTECEQVNSNASKANLALGLVNTFSSCSWNSRNCPSNIRKATPGIRFIIIEPTSRIRFKNNRKCPALSNPHERITQPTLWKRLERPGLTDLKTRQERWFHTDLQDCSWFREDKLVRWKQNTKTREKYNRPKTSIPVLSWANIRKWNENFSTEWRPLGITCLRNLHTRWTLSRAN